MDIVSPFKDYYDSALRRGLSSTLRFHRKTESFGYNNEEDPVVVAHRFMLQDLPRSVSTNEKKGTSIKLSPFRVAFCGKLYNALRAQYWDSPIVWDREDPARSEFIYTTENLGRFLSDAGFAPDDNAKHNSPSKRWTESLPPVMDYLAAEPSSRHHGFFVANSEAIVLAKPEAYNTLRVELNPCLADVSFFKVMDPWQAFQELEMFLGGIAAPENRPPVIIADKDRIMQHGFDKMSFRKAPTKRVRG
jgi:hypothetical protein